MNHDNNITQIDALIADLESPVGLCAEGGNIGGWRCAVIKGATDIIKELLK